MVMSLVPFAAQALTVSPPKIELTADPGKTISGSFLVSNEQQSKKTFYTTFENFEAQGETGVPKFVAATEGLGAWITGVSQVTLDPGQEKKIDFQIHVPRNAEPGGHFAGIFLGTSPPEMQGGGQVSVGAKIGVLVFLRVSGNIPEGGHLLGFGTSQKVFAHLPVNFWYRFQNGGADRVKPDGIISITHLLVRTHHKVSANKAESNVLPYTTRRLEVPWVIDPILDATGAALPPVEPLGFWANVGYEWKHFAFGPYSATLDFTYGATKTPVHATTHFYVIPWQLLIIIFLVIIIIGLFGSVGIRRYNRWIIAKARASR